MNFAKPLISLSTLALTALALAACAHQPAKAPPVASVSVPVAPAATPAPVAEPTGNSTSELTDDGLSAIPVTDAPDLLARIRTDFALQDVDSEHVDSQLTYFVNHPEYLERTFGRAELWLYYIVGQLEARHMPGELALLPVIESGFQSYAYSRARASGMWQFISDTGRHFGLKQDWWYDGRRDPIEATRAALDYLQALHDEFAGDWLLAIAAYNCGENAVERAIQANQREGLPTDFWHLRLPRETRAYVPELLAMRRLVGDPTRYGLEISHIPNAPYFGEVHTGGQIDIKLVADLAHVSTEELYQLNPAFHRWATDPTGPNRLLVPLDAAPGLQTALDMLTPDQRMKVEPYTVKAGDTVASIASQAGTRPDVIRELNNLSPSDPLVIAATLRVPTTHTQLPPEATRAAMIVDAPLYYRPRLASRRPMIRIVRSGDTLYRLAHRMHTDVRTLARLNGLSPGAHLHPGQRLQVSASVRYPHGRFYAHHRYYAHQRYAHGHRHSRHGSRVAVRYERRGHKDG